MRRFVFFLAFRIPFAVWDALGRPKGWLDAWAVVAGPAIRWGAADAKSTR